MGRRRVRAGAARRRGGFRLTTPITEAAALEAARLLSDHWRAGRHVDDLPAACRPASRRDGARVQALWAGLTGSRIGGWKIAATSLAGQQHIGVSGPLAGPVFAHRVHGDGATLSLADNRMRVAECEVVFRFGRTLAPRAGGYSRAEVLAAVSALHPGIEAPDSRFLQFERAGEGQLIADCACCHDMVVGAPVAPDARVDDLPGLVVRARLSDGRSAEGVGRNVLTDPVVALVWLVNELSGNGCPVEAGHFVTTGACVPPIPVTPGVSVEADFGWLGRVGVRFA